MENEKRRLIDANAAIKAMNAVYIHFWEDAEDGVEKCVNILHNAPTVDAVEVVRCRDCKNVKKGELFGTLWCNATIVKGDYFCASGERKDNG